MKFLDSNILIYAADETDRSKFDTACDIVDSAVRGNNFMISAQVLNEFASVMYRKFKKPDDEVDDLLSVLEAINTVPLNPKLTRRAIEIKKRYGLQFYDSLLLATAEANGCDEFWSEDLNDGQVYCGMKAVNPFK